jgi:hypothetical protein
VSNFEVKGLVMKGVSDPDADDLGGWEDASSPRGTRAKPGGGSGPSYSSNVVRKKVQQSRENLPLFGQFDVPLDASPAKHSINPNHATTGQISPRGYDGRKYSLPSDSVDVNISFDLPQRPASIASVTTEFKKEVVRSRNTPLDSSGSGGGKEREKDLNNASSLSILSDRNATNQEHKHVTRQPSSDALSSRPVRRPLVRLPPDQQKHVLQQQQQDQLQQQQQQPQREVEDWTTS